MKIVSTLLLICSFSIFATDTEDYGYNKSTTGVEITPSIPLMCEDRDYDFVSRVENISVVENELQLEIHFYFHHFACYGMRKFPRELVSPRLELWKKGIHWPGSYIPNSSVIQESPTLTKFIVSINKKRIFKKKNKKTYKMSFHPNGYSTFQYPWLMELHYSRKLDQTHVTIK